MSDKAEAQRADRYNEGKPQLSYLLDAPLAMTGLAKRFELGAKKYSRNNWKKGLDDVEVIDCLMRHLMAYANGDAHDEDGGEHVDAILWNAVVLSEQYHQRKVKMTEAGDGYWSRKDDPLAKPQGKEHGA